MSRDPSPAAILDTLRHHIVNHFDVLPEGLDDDTPFTALGLDSLGLVDFMFQIEDLYDVRIEHDEAMAEPTLKGLANLVARLLQGASAVPVASVANVANAA